MMTFATPQGQLRPPPAVRYLETQGPYDLREVASMSFGHRDEREFDGVMRLAFCLDGSYERPVGVELRQDGRDLELTIHREPPEFTAEEFEAVALQVARVVSADADGQAFVEMCARDPVLSRVAEVAPGFRPALFYSPYEAAVWSIVSARRVRAQGMAARQRLAEQAGTTFDLAHLPTATVPTPSALLALTEVPGIPRDRIPRLHAVAEAARWGQLSAERLRALPPEQAMAELQQLPGIGPFYASLIVLRACGHTDVLPLTEERSRAAVRELYGLEGELSDEDYAAFAERWRPFRTWAAVALRALGPRLGGREWAEPK